MKLLLKRYSICLAGILFFFCSACRTHTPITETINQTVPSSVPSSEPTEAAATKHPEPLTIRLGFSTDESDPRAVASAKFKELVETESGGTLCIELYPDGMLGDDQKLILGIIDGSVDMTVSSAGNFASFGKVGISAFPFLFQDFEEAWAFMDGPLVAEVNAELLEYNIHVLAHFDNGFRCITTSKSTGPIYALTDLEELSIRTSSNPIVQETLSELGARPQSLPFPELYDALKEGRFDAQENPIPVIYNHKLYEVQDYLAITNHSYDAMPFVIREDLWQSLSAAEQELLSRAALTVQELNRSLNKEQTETYISLLEEAGMTITYPDTEVLKEATRGVYDYFAPSYGKELMERLLKEQDE